MNEQYPNLSWALTDNLCLKTIICEEYKHNSHYLSDLNKLISELISYKCEGIQEKLKDVKTLNKFSSTLSELELALLIAKNKEINELKLLSDDYLPSKSPDILFRDEVFTSYVEVTRVNENPYITDIILSRLSKILKFHPYRVDVSLNTELSIPKMKRTERHIQKDLVEKSLDMFEEIFQEKLANNTFQTPSDVIDTKSLIFTVERTNSGKGYPRFISSDCIEVPMDVLCDYIKKRLIEKAIKRNSFVDEHRNVCYIIALHWDEPSIDEIDITKLLYGHTNHLASNIMGLSEADYTKWKADMWNSINNNIRNSASWIIIEQAKNRGWEALLIEKCLIPNEYSYVDNEGIFLSEKEMKNVSGVLLRNKWNKITFHPNPFCDIEINDPRILDFK